MNTSNFSQFNDALSSRVREGASQVFLQPVVGLDRSRSRPGLVLGLIGIIALSGACITRNLETTSTLAAVQPEATAAEAAMIHAERDRSGEMPVVQPAEAG